MSYLYLKLDQIYKYLYIATFELFTAAVNFSQHLKIG